MKKPDFSKKQITVIAMMLVFIVGFVLIIASISMLVQYSNEVAEQTSSKAAYHTLLTRQETERLFNESTTQAKIAASTVSDMTTYSQMTEYLSLLSSHDGFSDVLPTLTRYWKDGVLYSYNGDEYLGEDCSREYYEKYPNVAGYTGIYNDTSTVNGTMTVVGFIAPVHGSDFADAVVIYYPRNKLESCFAENTRTDAVEFSVLCNSVTGEALIGTLELKNERIFDVVRLKVGDLTPVENLRALMQSGENGTIAVTIQGEDYLLSVASDPQSMTGLSVVELYSVEKLSASSFAFIDTIIVVFILFAIISAIVVIYQMVHRAILKREFLNLETNDKFLDCMNRHGFEKEARKILDRNKNSYFAVIVFHLRHYKYLLDTFGKAEIDRTLQHLRTVSAKTLQIEETYGHIEEGQFLLLLHTKDRDTLVERLRIHALLATRYKSTFNFDMLMKYGIYEVDFNENVSLTQMIDFASEAGNARTSSDESNVTMQFNFYDSELRRIRLIHEDMELRMKSALHNGEFLVFYQPKYSLRNNKQDGCEALVRWYDPKTKEYNSPTLFMSLFETNGFIVQLDKYVFTKVCEYISYSIANGKPVFPVSVNVSRITAVQPDFVEYYAKTKRKYGIADGQLMIEFTESFAYENYETLYKIVEGLHKSGFKCSIDDFGCGYSSYRILKFLPMDEIKLDKFFIQKGYSEERDHHIFESIIQLAKKLGMKVTQEGVEEAEHVSLLRQLGCDVVQGFIYSHPLSLSDYLSFCSSTREHDLK